MMVESKTLVYSLSRSPLIVQENGGKKMHLQKNLAELCPTAPWRDMTYQIRLQSMPQETLVQFPAVLGL